MSRALYVYAIGRDLDLEPLKGKAVAVDGSDSFVTLKEESLTAVCSEVEASEFSQEAIDAHARDLDWLGRIGYAHQMVNQLLASTHSTIPLRAFTLFSSDEKLAEFLRDNSTSLLATVDRIGGCSEWTVRIDFDAAVWEHTLTRRVESLRSLEEEIAAAPAGRAFLLKKKLGEEKKKAAAEAEGSVVAEIESSLREAIDAPMIVERRGEREGSSPQISLLVRREEASRMKSIESDLAARYAPEGVSLVLTGPWPPYTFVNEAGQ